MIGLSDKNFIFLCFSLAFIFFVIDLSTSKCLWRSEPLWLIGFLYLHHLLAIFLYIGWLSSSNTILTLYIFTVLIIILHWFTNNQKCVLTQVINYFCSYDDSEGFHDIFYFVGLKNQKWFDLFLYGYLIIAILISGYKIYSSSSLG